MTQQSVAQLTANANNTLSPVSKINANGPLPVWQGFARRRNFTNATNALNLSILMYVFVYC